MSGSDYCDVGDNLIDQPEAIHGCISMILRVLANNGHSPMAINAVMIGMARKSMEDIVGVEKAAEMDKEARLSIGWPE